MNHAKTYHTRQQKVILQFIEGRKEYVTVSQIDEYLKKQGVFDAEYVSGKVGEYIKTGDAGPATGANYSKITWSFFVFQQWYETYMRS